MKSLFTILLVGWACCLLGAEAVSEELANAAADAVVTLTQRWIENPAYPTHDAATGIGQGVCVEYYGSQNNAPARRSGIVVSRIITSPNGERWCLVEFGEGPPWKGYAITNLSPVACSEALQDFPSNGMRTVRWMLENETRQLSPWQ